MNQFSTIFAFEYKGVVRSKIYIVITVLLAVVLAVLLSLPTVISWFSGKDDSGESTPEQPKIEGQIALADGSADGSMQETLAGYAVVFAAYAPQYEFVPVTATEAELTEALDEDTYAGVLLLQDLLHARYLTQTRSMYDTLDSTIRDAMKYAYLASVMEDAGISREDAAAVAAAEPTVETVETGKSFLSAYICTYAMIMLLYMSVLLYGNMVATSVATEKSSRAMELLITTARPSSLMFGKVLGVGMAALTQLGILAAVALTFYQINHAAYAAIPMVSEILNVSASSIIYLFVFFILGFFLYAFLFGAMGSTISRLEEANTAALPIVFLVLIAFMISIVSMSSGNTDNLLVVIASFIPFFSPMVMYVRICMGFVPMWQIAVSVALMVGGNVLVGLLAAKIYRLGVVMYGKAPKLGALLRMLRQEKREKSS